MDFTKSSNCATRLVRLLWCLPGVGGWIWNGLIHHVSRLLQRLLFVLHLINLLLHLMLILLHLILVLWHVLLLLLLLLFNQVRIGLNLIRIYLVLVSLICKVSIVMVAFILGMTTILSLIGLHVLVWGVVLRL